MPRRSAIPALFRVVNEHRVVAEEVTRAAQDEYGADYDGAAQLYVATGTDLKDLTFTLSARHPGLPVRALVHQNSQYFEVKSVPATTTLSKSSLVVHDLADLATGVSVQDNNGTPLKVVFTHGAKSMTDHSMTVEKTDEVAVTAAPVRAQLTPTKGLQVLAAGAPLSTKVNTRIIDSGGNVKTLPAHP